MSLRTFLSSIPAWLLVLLPLGLALVHDETALDPVLHPRMFVLGVFLLLILPFQFQTERWKKALGSRAALFYLGFIAVATLSWLWHGGGAESLVPLLKDLAFFILFIAASSIDWLALKKSNLSWTALLTLLLVLGFTFQNDIAKHWQGSISDFPYTELRGPMAHHNLLASALLLLIPFGLLNTSRKSYFKLIFTFLLIILALVLVYFTRSRSALMAAVAGFTVLGLSFLARKRIPQFFSSKASLGILLLVLAIPIFLVQYKLLLSTTGEGKALESPVIETTGTEKNFTTGERLQMWDYTLAMIQDHGLLGVGSGNWRIEFPMYGSELYRARQGIVQFQRPHNDYLWIWAESGPFALLFYLGFLIAIVQLAFRQMRTSESASPYLMLAVALVFLIVSVFSFPHERIFHRSLFILAAGLLNASALSTSSKLRLNQVMTFIIFGLFMLVLGLFSWAGHERWQGERITRKMIVAHGQGQWKDLLQLKAETDPLHFYQISPVGMPMEFYSGLAHLNQLDYDKALEEYSLARKHHPNSLQVTNNLANTFALKGEVDSAIVYYQKAIRISPFYKEGILNLVSIYFNNGFSAQAYTLLREKAAEFDEDRNMYEAYLIPVLRRWAKEEGQDISGLNDQELIRLHYILAYDIPQEPALSYLASQAQTN